MANIDIINVLVLNTVISAIACIPFGLACKTQKDLRPWLFTYIFLAVGNLFAIFQFDNFTIRLIASILFALTALFLFIAVFIEYHKLFIKSNNQNLIVRDKLIAVIVVSPIITGIGIFMIIVVSISIVMLLRIYLKTHSSTKFFLLMTSISALLCIIAITLQIIFGESAYLFGNVLTTFFGALMLSTGFIAIIEEKLTIIGQEKFKLKDKYSHNLSNLLQAMYTTIDLIELKNNIPMAESVDLFQLIREKIDESKNLINEIRIL